MDTKVYYIDEENIDLNIIDRAAEVIRSGGTVIFPTETVYGLGANALSSEAVSRIFNAKKRPADNPLIVHITCLDMLIYLISEPISKTAQILMDRFWPGPLTLIFKKSPRVPFEVSPGLDTVSIRMPDNPIAFSLIEKSGLPIAAPSANLSGKPSPTLPEHVIEDMSGRVDMILCGSQSRVGVESTVLDLTGDVPVILRPGGVTYEELKEAIGNVIVDPGLVKQDEVPKAPGMKYTHYAPEADMIIVKGHIDAVEKKIQQLIADKLKDNIKVGVLASDETKDIYKNCKVISLGSREDYAVMASRMFAALREFDKAGVDIIYAEAIEEINMGMAVMNRMKKAAGFNIIEV
ncbi:MAG: L-threonylcarbamoyladenylate synthase [Bacillota bacterium]